MAEATVCLGCGKELDLFANHLSAVIKVERNVSQQFSVAQLTGEELTIEMLDADDEDELYETVVGTKSGVAAGGLFHDVSCLTKYLKHDEITEKGVADLKIRKNREDDSHLYADAMAEGNGE